MSAFVDIKRTVQIQNSLWSSFEQKAQARGLTAINLLEQLITRYVVTDGRTDFQSRLDAHSGDPELEQLRSRLDTAQQQYIDRITQGKYPVNELSEVEARQKYIERLKSRKR